MQFQQGQLASLVRISQTYLSQIENNKKIPTVCLLQKIADTLSIPLPLLFFFAMDRRDVPKPNRSQFKRNYPLIKDYMYGLINNHI